MGLHQCLLHLSQTQSRSRRWNPGQILHRMVIVVLILCVSEAESLEILRWNPIPIRLHRLLHLRGPLTMHHPGPPPPHYSHHHYRHPTPRLKTPLRPLLSPVSLEDEKCHLSCSMDYHELFWDPKYVGDGLSQKPTELTISLNCSICFPPWKSLKSCGVRSLLLEVVRNRGLSRQYPERKDST